MPRRLELLHRLEQLEQLEQRRLFAGAAASAMVTVSGTSGNDVIQILVVAEKRVAIVNGQKTELPDGRQIFVDGGAGDDKIVADAEFPFPLLITGSGGRDTIIGGAMNDSISGGNGRDKLFGEAGNDHLLGAAQGDWLFGGLDSDTLSGAGGNDRLVDTSGGNYLLGGGGNDVFVAVPLEDAVAVPDTISGGDGKDLAQIDASDARASIEEILG